MKDKTRNKTEKKSKLEFKELDIEDWRGLLAVTIIIGGFVCTVALVALGKPEAIGGIATLMYAVADWYYKAKEKEAE